VLSIHQLGLREFRIVTDDAAVGLPEIVEAISNAGGDVESAREARPSFEEVFAELVERDRLERERAIETPPEEPDDVPEPDTERRPPDDLPPPQIAPGTEGAPDVQRAPSEDDQMAVGGARGRRL
jgi:hypothetical protein